MAKNTAVFENVGVFPSNMARLCFITTPCLKKKKQKLSVI